MTLARKNGSAKAGQPINTGMSQAVPQNTVENPFDGRFSVSHIHGSYFLRVGDSDATMFRTLDSLMTFLADQAIEKMGRVEQ
jgi:hypothetical protein